MGIWQVQFCGQMPPIRPAILGYIVIASHQTIMTTVTWYYIK